MSIFIHAKTFHIACDVARALDMHPTRWQFLDRPHLLDGYKSVQIYSGHGYWDHPAADDIADRLVAMFKARPESVVIEDVET